MLYRIKISSGNVYGIRAASGTEALKKFEECWLSTEEKLPDLFEIVECWAEE